MAPHTFHEDRVAGLTMNTCRVVLNVIDWMKKNVKAGIGQISKNKLCRRQVAVSSSSGSFHNSHGGCPGSPGREARATATVLPRQDHVEKTTTFPVQFLLANH